MRLKIFGALLFFCTIVFTETVGFGVSALITWVVHGTGGASALKIDLQSKLGCPGGSLADIGKRIPDTSLKLERGADSLFICADRLINTTLVDAPRALAKDFPGCLNYITGSLRMLRGSDAICALPDNGGYICDGVKGTEVQGTEALGSEASAVKPCPAETLTQFGFAPGS
ncbi:hypothetical protein ASC96_12105 [Rhizobium sp. Root1204]|nr:hypothetical protein ASC96_12105 [Rhizobium sp. Root1204]